MTRTVLAVMAGLMCGLIGMKQAASLHTEERRLRRWTALLQRLCVILREQSGSLPEAFCRAADGTQAPDLLMREIAAHLQTHPSAALPRAFAAHCPPCREHETLDRLFTGLGRGSLEARLLCTEQGMQELSLMAAEAGKRAEQDAKLYQTLGWTGGACLTLFLL